MSSIINVEFKAYSFEKILNFQNLSNKSFNVFKIRIANG